MEEGDAKSGKNSPKTEEKFGNCYCGKDRNLNIVELLCVTCNRWFHESCIGFQLGRLVPFLQNYVFVCKNCSVTGLETFRKTQATIPQMCITAIANLRQASIKEGKPRLMFSKDQDIIPYMDHYWESMTTMSRRSTQSWYATVQRTLIKDLNTLFTYEESGEHGQMYGLVQDLTQVKPNYEDAVQGRWLYGTVNY
ncbi:hypothetical protein quinque_013445 [Culex quinquefasciatus]